MGVPSQRLLSLGVEIALSTVCELLLVLALHSIGFGAFILSMGMTLHPDLLGSSALGGPLHLGELSLGEKLVHFPCGKVLEFPVSSPSASCSSLMLQFIAWGSSILFYLQLCPFWPEAPVPDSGLTFGPGLKKICPELSPLAWNPWQWQKSQKTFSLSLSLPCCRGTLAPTRPLPLHFLSCALPGGAQKLRVSVPAHLPLLTAPSSLLSDTR